MNFDEILNTEPGVTKTVVHTKPPKWKRFLFGFGVIYVFGCAIYVTTKILMYIFL